MLQRLTRPPMFCTSLILAARMRRITLGAALAALCLTAFAQPAGADTALQPQKVVWDQDITPQTVAPRICPSFDVTESGHQTGAVTYFFDGSGALRQIQLHAIEQLTLSANGRTLRTEPIHVNGFVDFLPDGQVQLHFDGLILRVPLPDGTTFLSAGRVQASSNLVVIPDAGLSGDVGALCAALS